MELILFTVVCVKWGTKYSAEYVHRLQHMVAKNLPCEYEFVCYTDDPFNLNCKTIPITTDLEIYWNKVALFQPGMFTGEVLYFDLDLVIQNPIDALVRKRDALTGIYTHWDPVITNGRRTRNQERWRYPFNSSVLRWTAQEWYHVWEKFILNKDYYLIEYDGGGDDKFLWHEISGIETFNDVQIYSRLHGMTEKDYEAKQRSYILRTQKEFYYPEAHICLFDGRTTEEHYKGFEHYWS